jgi:uncharacterized membrane protein
MTHSADPLSLLDPRVAEHVRAMERRIAALEAALAQAQPGEAMSPVPPATVVVAARTVWPRKAEAARSESASTMTPPERQPSPVPPPAYLRTRANVPKEPPKPNWLWRWITGGNALARIGVVVLFIGVAFLLKYASDRITVPIEARLAAVALGATALLVFGWRLRAARAGYAMTLQGAGVGILYLTVFVALRLYHVLPPGVAFVLLFAIGALSSFLAIRQDAMALVVLGVLGGFAAPLLTSSGGSHVTLFSYYAVLNAAILAIAWFKAWRVLNVVGFACTFVVATLWGVVSYRPEDFATTEPFLILFFLFYVAIATLYALRSSLELRRYVDATLVFGTPLVAAGLQDALVRDIPYALASSAACAAAIYLSLAWLLAARGLRLLVDAFAALGIVFASLAVPLAFDARLTSATWALEGAALVWMGVRQSYRSARFFGLLLQFAAGIAFALAFSPWSTARVAGSMPVLNSDCLGALLVAFGGFASSRVLSRATAPGSSEHPFVSLVFAWGLLWWLGAGSHEIERFAASDVPVALLVVFLAGSAALFGAVGATLDWPLARVPALAFPAALLVIAAANMVYATQANHHLFAGGGFLAWPLALIVEVVLLRHFERTMPPVGARAIDTGHAIVVWLVSLIVAQELGWLARTSLGAEWRLVPWGAVPALALVAIASLTARPLWPFATHARAYLRGGAMPIATFALLWTLYANIASAGDFAPWPFVPLANPLDLAQALVFIATASWLARLRSDDGDASLRVSTDALGVAAALLLVFWVTCTTLRSVHHAAGVPWSLASLWASRIAQSALSLVWSLFALAAMVVANRRGYRIAWVAGATLLGIVVAKLFVVDLAQVGGVERIVSFIGVGALLLVVGYVAPVPPRQEAP